MKSAMTLMLSAEPSSLRPSKPAPKTMVESEQEPRSRFEALTVAAGVVAAVLLETAEAG